MNVKLERIHKILVGAMKFSIRLNVNYCKYKDVRPRKGVNKPFENFYVSGVFRNFFREGAPNFNVFSSVFFPEELF